MSSLSVIPLSADLVEEVARIVGQRDDAGQDLTVVFPGKRPSLYLKARLAAAHGSRAFFPPRCLSLDELTDLMARRQKPAFRDISRTDAVWIVFELIRSMTAFKGHPFRKMEFGAFFPWGIHLVNFIERLDLEKIESPALANVERNAAIGYDVPRSVNDLLSKISLLRDEFHSILDEREYFTRGTKHIAAGEEAQADGPGGPKDILFAGLFGLTGTERRLVKSFWDKGCATVILNGDPAEWPVLKNLITYLKASAESGDIPVAETPAVHLHAGHDSHSEVLEAHRIISEGSPLKTAIILPQSDALFPVLDFVADRIDRPCNVSLGYPVERTSLFDLVRQILGAAVDRRPDGRYPVAAYLAVILHPFVKNIDADKDLRGLLSYIERCLSDSRGGNPLAGRRFLSPGDVESAASLWDGIEKAPQAREALLEIHRLFFRTFTNAATVADVAASLEETLRMLLNKTPVHSYVLSGAIFESFFRALGSLRQSLFGNARLAKATQQNLRAIRDITLHYLGTALGPFDTHPVEELEVLGMLESRNISFERVIVLDVNEGVLPGPREISPLVPMGVFETLGIPSPEFTEAIYRYNLYRLIAGAAEAHLIYRSTPETQRSRYIEEILWNKERDEKRLGALEVDRYALPVNLRREIEPPVIEKTGAVLTALAKKTISPSTLDEYMKCPLLCYFTRFIGLDERKGTSDSIEATERGDMIHRILHDAFKPFLGRELTTGMKDLVMDSLQGAIEDHFDAAGDSGELYLFRSIASYKLRSFVTRHMDHLRSPVIISHLEEPFEGAITVNGSTVRISGKIDRVDRDPASGTHRIIDYKTGSERQYRPGVLKKTDFGDMMSIHEHVRSVQLPLYMRLFAAREGAPLESMDAVLMHLGDNSEEHFFPRNTDRSDILDAYARAIDTVLSHLLDPGTPFSAFDTRKCMDCRARDLCHV